MAPDYTIAGKRKVLWHNMREEPVLYINGKPYVVRESNKPFANLEYTGKFLEAVPISAAPGLPCLLWKAL